MNGIVSKTIVGSGPPRVRIPPSPLKPPNSAVFSFFLGETLEFVIETRKFVGIIFEMQVIVNIAKRPGRVR